MITGCRGLPCIICDSSLADNQLLILNGFTPRNMNREGMITGDRGLPYHLRLQLKIKGYLSGGGSDGQGKLNGVLPGFVDGKLQHTAKLCNPGDDQSHRGFDEAYVRYPAGMRHGM